MEQNERAFQKQPHIFLLPRKVRVGKKKGGKTTTKTAKRYYKNVGLGVKTPKEAIEGHYIDKKCPWVGQVSIRGRILKGTVVSTKMKRTIVIRRDYLHYVKKYNRYEKRHSNLSAHVSPAHTVREGDTVIVGECRPISKTVRFNVLKVVSSKSAGKAFSKF